MRGKPVFTTEEHWKFFAEFVKWETRAGGPDPHLLLAAHLSKDCSLVEKYWRAGCYIAVYNAPFGEAIWRAWSWERFCSEPEALLPWLQENWSKIVTRRERRCVRRPEWMHQYLVSYGDWVRRLPEELQELQGLGPEERYEALWEKVLEVNRLGRYVALKLLEFYRVCCDVDAVLPDLRPKGGWSPRQTLGDLWPGNQVVATEDDSPEVLALANRLTSQTQARLAGDFGLSIDKFKLQVLLCDYKQSWKGRRQYPGRSIDSEQLYAYQAEALWGIPSETWGARQELFARAHLGELQGWLGPRERAAHALADHHYTWSDLCYDYVLTRDFAQPVARANAPVASSARVHPILDGRLYQSGSWNELSVERQQAFVKEHKITGVVSLWRGEKPHKVVGWHWAVPIADGKALPISRIEEVVEEVVRRLRVGERLVVMCHAGRNRSALINALVVRKILGCSGKEAVRYVQHRRPNSLANPDFHRHVATKQAPLLGL